MKLRLKVLSKRDLTIVSMTLCNFFKAMRSRPNISNFLSFFKIHAQPLQCAIQTYDG